MQYTYGAIFLASLILIPLYFFQMRKKQQSEPWLFVLFVSVAIVNLGYTLTAFSKTVDFALFANKITYLGQVVIPLCMFMIVSRLCGYTYKKWVTGALIGASVLMFAIICTTGYLNWYYTDATIETIAGTTILRKEYGVLHPTNLIYVICYFVAMIAVFCVSLGQKKVASQMQACIILAVVVGNIGFWCIQKILPWDFELLSVMYLISAFSFLGVWLMLQNYVHINDIPKPAHAEEKVSVIFMDSRERAEKVEQIISSLPEGTALTARQTDVLEGILAGKSRKEMAADLHLSENTIKMHTTSLFKALKVTSREEIFALIKA